MKWLYRIEHQCVICNVGAAIFAVVVAGPLTWWAIDRTPAYEVVAVGHAVPNPVKAGEELDLVREVRVNRSNCEAWFNREIIDSTGFVWTFPVTRSTFAQLQVGQYPTHSVTRFVVPYGVAAGDAKVFSNIWSACNPVQKFFPVHQKTPELKIMVLRSERGTNSDDGQTQ